MKGTGLFMKELADKNIKELVAMRKEAKKELFELRMKNSVRALKETHKIGDLRVKIARINTVLHSKVNA
jgi:ribosomal protein L29